MTGKPFLVSSIPCAGLLCIEGTALFAMQSLQSILSQAASHVYAVIS